MNQVGDSEFMIYIVIQVFLCVFFVSEFGGVTADKNMTSEIYQALSSFPYGVAYNFLIPDQE